MTNAISDCDTRFGHTDFDTQLVDQKRFDRCPVVGCSTRLVDVPYRKGTKPWCATHGIRLHAGTFVYWNGADPDSNDRARLRNFIGDETLVRHIALKKGMKAESHRLGYEMSEDALSWDVFTSLASVGKLGAAVEFLTGRTPTSEPTLYLWGRSIYDDGIEYAPLLKVRDALERGVRNFVTEPDIMLVVESELVVLIEAKFGSGNTLANDAATKEGAKPTSVEQLLVRYLGAECIEPGRQIFQRDRIGHPLHSQLFRNLVFASRMAGTVPWYVVNLVSRKQFSKPSSGRYSYADPELDVRRYLHPDFRTDSISEPGKVSTTPSFVTGRVSANLRRTCAGRAPTFCRHST